MCSRAADGALAHLVEEVSWELKSAGGGEARIQATLARAGDDAEGATFGVVSTLGGAVTVKTFCDGGKEVEAGGGWEGEGVKAPELIPILSYR